jgi:hypothetical protein
MHVGAAAIPNRNPTYFLGQASQGIIDHRFGGHTVDFDGFQAVHRIVGVGQIFYRAVGDKTVLVIDESDVAIGIISMVQVLEFLQAGVGGKQPFFNRTKKYLIFLN